MPTKTAPSRTKRAPRPAASAKPAKKPAVGEAAISDAAVTKATGKSWKQWLALLDKFDVGRHGHAAAARWLGEKHKVPPWWRQMITVRYEQERGLREPGMRSTGDFRLSVSRTIAAPRQRAFAAMTQAAELSKWFTREAACDLRVAGSYSNADGDHGVFKTIDPPKRLRFTWENPKHCPGTMIEVRFEAKGEGRTVVCLEHQKLRSRKDLEHMRAGWSWAMDSLKAYLETGKPIRHEDWITMRGS